MKTFFRFMFISLIISLSAFVVYGHPGGTDSSGGHKNSDTGIYHYHHGYSEHQHTNGFCPYNYNDKTGYSSGSRSINSIQTVYPSVEQSDRSVSVPNNNKAEADSVTNDSSSSAFSFCIILLLIAGLVSTKLDLNVFKRENAELKKRTDSLSKELAKYKSAFSICANENLDMKSMISGMNQNIEAMEQEIENMQSAFIKKRKFSEVEIRKISYVPDNITFDRHKLPHCSNPDVERNMLVYVSDTGFSYHRKEGCSGAYRPMHLFIAAKTFVPCRSCINAEAWGWKIPIWYYRYLQLQALNDSIDNVEGIRIELPDPMVDSHDSDDFS